MIHIFEKPSEKLSGNTSMFLSFPYNPEIIKLIKATGSYNYNPKTTLWEIPITVLAELLDNLTFYDDISLNILDDSENAVEQREISISYKTKPFDYQLEGIRYMINHDKLLLLDQCGLGKTIQIIYTAEELKKQAGLKHCFIICCQNSLKTNWKKEIEKHSTLSCKILGEKINKNGKATYGTVSERLAELKDSEIPEFFIITNLETLRDEKAPDSINKSVNDIDMIVIDEVHRMKSSKSQGAKSVLKMKKATHRIAATGTLLLNSPLDAYVPLVWIDKEKQNLTGFKKSYCVYEFAGAAPGKLLGYKNMDILKDMINSCSIRRVKEDVLKELPPKTIIPEYVDMSDSHRKFYDGIVKGVKEEIDKVDLVTLKRKNLLALVTRLRQATACPSILSSDSSIESSKLDRCVDLAEQIISNGEKVVIMSTFKESVNKLSKLLEQYDPLICTGDEDEITISKNIDTFQTDPSRKILLATWQKMGTGFTLNAASYMINIDTAWTWGLFEQTCDRIYRIGTKKPVFIYNLICKDTIDERVWYLLNLKKSVSDYVVDDMSDDQALELLGKYILDL